MKLVSYKAEQERKTNDKLIDNMMRDIWANPNAEIHKRDIETDGL